MWCLLVLRIFWELSSWNLQFEHVNLSVRFDFCYFLPFFLGILEQCVVHRQLQGYPHEQHEVSQHVNSIQFPILVRGSAPDWRIAAQPEIINLKCFHNAFVASICHMQAKVLKSELHIWIWIQVPPAKSAMEQPQAENKRCWVWARKSGILGLVDGGVHMLMRDEGTTASKEHPRSLTSRGLESLLPQSATVFFVQCWNYASLVLAR